MKYRHFVFASPAEVAPADMLPARPAPVADAVARVHRLPPVIQFLTPPDPSVSRYLGNVALQAHLQGAARDAVIEQVAAVAARLGYTAIISAHEAFAVAMPSFPGQRIHTLLLLVDLSPL